MIGIFMWSLHGFGLGLDCVSSMKYMLDIFFASVHSSYGQVLTLKIVALDGMIGAMI